MGIPVNRNESLSPFARKLMTISAAVFGLVGLILFLVPNWAAANFSWKVSPMVAMTMGGWCLGTAVMAGIVAYRHRWNVIYASLLYLGTFSVTESIVLVIHRARINLDAALAWPYIGMLALGVLTAFVVLSEWWRRKPTLTDEGGPVAAWARVVVWNFIFFVFSLSAFAFSAQWTGVGLGGGVFPEPLTLFTLRGFGAFYFSLALSVCALVRTRRADALTVHVQGGTALIVFITLAALVYLEKFNFSEKPLQTIYPGVYLAALCLSVLYLWKLRMAPPVGGGHRVGR